MMACRLVMIIGTTGYFFDYWTLADDSNLGLITSLLFDLFFLLSLFGLNLLSRLNGCTILAVDAVCGLELALIGSLVFRLTF